MADFKRSGKANYGERGYNRSSRNYRDEASGKFGEHARRDSDRSERFEGRRSESQGRGSSLEMHKVTCDKCGIECEVPFKPTTSKPVYCRDCFRKGGSEARGRSDRSSDELHENELHKINMKLDKIMNALKIQ